VKEAVKFYLDEHISHAILKALRRNGFDAMTAVEAGLNGEADPVHLEFAASQGRVLISQDDDFLRLHAAGVQHAGILPNRKERIMSLLAFYRGTGRDHDGRRIADIWAFSRDQLESIHDFIQWLFPLEVPSPVNPEAPTLDAETIAEFRKSPELQANLRKSLAMMLDFYGLEERAGQIAPAAAFAERSANWLSPNNHNHLRLTRIMHCLWLCGLEGKAQALLECLLRIAQQHPNAVTSRTLSFWRGAVGPG
jgi:hypothetical protein